MTDETIAKIKEVNQRLSDLCGLEYTDFYRPVKNKTIIFITMKRKRKIP